MSVFECSLQTLSPVHIGDGYELKKDFDFVVSNGQFYRLDEDALLAAREHLLKPKPNGRYPTPGELLQNELDRPEFFRYVLRGAPRSAHTDARVKSFIKDVHDRPYIPGSSLKGALRTALAWNAWEEVRPRLDRNAIGRNRSWAAQPLEKKLFGPDPNHSLLRALHAGDLSGPQNPGEGLLVVNAQVLTRGAAGSPIELEALAGNTELKGSLTIDDTLFSPLTEKELGFASRRRWLDELMPRAQRHSQARIQKLLTWFEQVDGCEKIARFYRQLAAVQLDSSSALVQIGWGGGWDSKTFGTHLQQDASLFEQLITEFRMEKNWRNSKRHTGDDFPRSRRAAMLVKEKVAVASAPFGWALLTLKRK
jgi:CRISPR-associated protein Csm5